MKKKILFILAFLSLSLTVLAATPPMELTLEKAEELALQQNVDIRLAQKNVELFHTQYHEALSYAFPDISFSGTAQHNYKEPVIFFGDQSIPIGTKYSYDAQVNATQALYAGGRVLKGVSAAKLRNEGEEALYAATRDQVLFGVKQLFFNGLLAKQLTAIEQDSLNSVEEHLKTIQERFKQGLDSDLVVRRQDVQVAGAKTLVIRAQNAHDLALTSLQEILSLDVNQPLVLKGELAPPGGDLKPFEMYQQRALERRPDLIAARKRTLMSKNLITIAKADRLPTVGLYGRYDWSGESDRLEFSPDLQARSLVGGIQVSQVLFQGGRITQKIRQARIAYDQAVEEEGRVQRAVQVDVKRQWLSVKEAKARADAEVTAIDQAKLALQATEARYKAGQADQLELTDATVALNRARTLYSTASYDYWVSLASLERAIGSPVTEVK